MMDLDDVVKAYKSTVGSCTFSEGSIAFQFEDSMGEREASFSLAAFKFWGEKLPQKLVVEVNALLEAAAPAPTLRYTGERKTVMVGWGESEEAVTYYRAVALTDDTGLQAEDSHFLAVEGDFVWTRYQQ